MTESKNLAPLISVIVPVYNVAEYLPECVDSICNQSYKNLEIILVDDGSTDNSGKICDEYAKKDLRIKVIHKENGGLSDARNTGIEIAQGEWISFVDSDDLISNHMYEKMYEAGLIYSASLVCCQSTQDYKNINTISGDSEIKVMTDKTDMIRQMFNGGGQTISSCLKLYRREIFNNLRFSIGKTNEDAFIILDIIEQTSCMIIIPDILYYYRQRVGSITRTQHWRKGIFDTVEAYKKHLRTIQEKYPDVINEAEMRLCWAYRTDIALAMSTDAWQQHIDEINQMRNEFRLKYIHFILNQCVSIRGKIDSSMLVILPLKTYSKVRNSILNRIS